MAAALLGLQRRDPPAPNRTPWRDRAVSSYEAPLGGADVLQLGRAAQLPPFGEGNGLEALFWTPVARLAPEHGSGILAALERVGIAAWIAPVRAPNATAAPLLDLWVASLSLDAAQDVLMRELAERG